MIHTVMLTTYFYFLVANSNSCKSYYSQYKALSDFGTTFSFRKRWPLLVTILSVTIDEEKICSKNNFCLTDSSVEQYTCIFDLYSDKVKKLNEGN